MSNGDKKSDTYHQYGYDQFAQGDQPSSGQGQDQSFYDAQNQYFAGDQPPQAQPHQAEQHYDAEPLFPYLFREFIVKPVSSTAFLLIAASIVMGAIVYGFVSGQGASPEDVPIIRADSGNIKESPDDPGGMDVAHRDSTIYDTLRAAEDTGEKIRKVENLLSSENEELVEDRVAAMENKPEVVIDARPTQKPQETASVSEKSVPAKPLIEVKSVKQEVEKIPPQELAAGAQGAAVSTPEKPQSMHEPGVSPDTIAYVRSVLERKDQKGNAQRKAPVADDTSTAQNSSAAALNNIAPAAGVASPAAANDIKAGSYFVQLASVTSKTGAHSEWGKLQDEYAAQLSQVSYRVQEADLGERGIYYRIQAGPMSKDSADKICGEIKAQKPGGCLVVK